jgi:probable rRNA maturation factor
MRKGKVTLAAKNNFMIDHVHIDLVQTEHVIDVQWCIDDRSSLPTEDVIKGWFQQCLRELEAQPTEVCLRIVNEKEISELNSQYRGKSGATNVLSFPNDAIDEGGRVLLGDIVICSDVVKAEAGNQFKSIEAHFAHLLVHGVLHLQGHDHSEDDQALVMETIEIKLMKCLGFSDPYE